MAGKTAKTRKSRKTDRIKKKKDTEETDKKTALMGVILFGSILVISAVLWMFGIISFLIYILIFVVCLIGGMKNAKRLGRLRAGL